MQAKHIESLESKRLKLVPFVWPAHQKVIQELIKNDPSMFMSSEKEIEQAAQRWYSINKKNYRELRIGYWTCLLKSSNTAIGYAGFLPLRDDPSTLEAGVSLLREHWNKGYAAEAVQACVKYAATINPTTFYAYVMPYNDAAKRLVKKLGFSYAGNEIRQGTEVEKYIYKSDK